MPLVQVDWAEGRSDDQKRLLVKKITEAVAEAGKCPPEAVTVIVRDLPKTNIGKAGTLMADR